MRAQAVGGGLPPGIWEGDDGPGNPARQEMMRQLAIVQAAETQARRN
jgi:hypothetical protein